MIYAMKDDDLKDLAGESEDIIAERHELQQQVKVLSDGLRKCQKYRPRQMTGAFLKPIDGVYLSGVSNAYLSPI